MTTLPDKVYSEYVNNAKLAERRYKFLKTMPKALRPIQYAEALKGWEEGRSRYLIESITKCHGDPKDLFANI